MKLKSWTITQYMQSPKLTIVSGIKSRTHPPKWQVSSNKCIKVEELSSFLCPKIYWSPVGGRLLKKFEPN